MLGPALGPSLLQCGWERAESHERFLRSGSFCLLRRKKMSGICAFVNFLKKCLLGSRGPSWLPGGDQSLCLAWRLGSESGHGLVVSVRSGRAVSGEQGGSLTGSPTPACAPRGATCAFRRWQQIFKIKRPNFKRTVASECKSQIKCVLGLLRSSLRNVLAGWRTARVPGGPPCWPLGPCAL